ncbi:MAG: hypothetical protein WA172_11925 [Terriglobales bacterium]
MYTISNAQGIILTCKRCTHIVQVRNYDLRLGSQRTQAATAMLTHSYAEHKTSPLTPLPKNYGVMEQW